MGCENQQHENFEAAVEVTPLVNREGGPVVGYQADLRIWCRDCDESMVFVGDYPLGVSPAGPTVDLAGQTLCVPLRPADAPEGWGLDRPGMIGRRVDGGLPPPEPN